MPKLIILILFIFLIASCSNNVVYTEFKGIPENKWQKYSIITFNYHSKDSVSNNAIYINLRNNNNYEFNNLYLIVSVEFPPSWKNLKNPTTTKIVDTLQYEMTDAKGYFLGTGFTDIKENKLEYKSNITFPAKGNYKFSIQHAMRNIGSENGVEFLNGITDVGIEIEKTNKTN